MIKIVEKCMFPGSIFSYGESDGLPIIYIRHRVKRKDCVLIHKVFPCLLVESENPKYTIIYFHGNGETLLSVYWMARDACSQFPIRFICPEYSGYGIRKGIVIHFQIN
jgi:hypothetical protein